MLKQIKFQVTPIRVMVLAGLVFSLAWGANAALATCSDAGDNVTCDGSVSVGGGDVNAEITTPANDNEVTIQAGSSPSVSDDLVGEFMKRGLIA